MRLASLAPLVLAVLAAGCGSDGDEEPQTPAVDSTRAAFIERADAVCADMRAEQVAISNRAPKTTEGQAAALREIAELHRDGMGRLEALEPPEDAAAVGRFIDTVRANAGVLDRAARAVEAGRVDESRSLVESVRAPTEDAVAGVRAYGLKVCGGTQG